MDPRVVEHAARAQARAQAARVRIVDLHANRGPVARLLLTALGIAITVVVLTIVLALALVLIPVILAVGLIAAATLYIRRRLATLGKPNERIAGVRTDGRSNVRVLDRD